MSIHTWKAYRIAERKGAWAGQDPDRWQVLAKLSKRELIEIALRLGASAAGECDNPQAGFLQVIDERDALRANNII